MQLREINAKNLRSDVKMYFSCSLIRSFDHLSAASSGIPAVTESGTCRRSSDDLETSNDSRLNTESSSDDENDISVFFVFSFFFCVFSFFFFNGFLFAENG
jgi:hypothetical protein